LDDAMTAQKRPAAQVVKLHPDTHARLRRLSREQDRPMGEIISDLLERYDRDEFWRQVTASVERLQGDAAAWEDYRQEITALETTSLDDEEPYFTPEEEDAIRRDAARTPRG
jgi:hypothetical protein